MKLKETTYLEIYQNDIHYIQNFLKDNLEELYFDEDYYGWFFTDEPLIDYLYYEGITILNPKEIIGTIENFIEKILQINR